MVLEAKYDLSHKERLVLGGNCTINYKDNIYSGVICMGNVRIRVFLRTTVWTLCCACDIGYACLYGKQKKSLHS
jgi:hypothetical protein